MTTATFIADAAITASAPARAEIPRKPRLGLMELIAAFGEAFEATRTYDALVEKGTPPADAARKALLGK